MQRRLTPGEVDLAKTVFGDSIDYSAVRVHDHRLMPPGLQEKTCAMALGNELSFPGDTHNADFSQESDIRKQSVFIHEMTHVWQHQNKVVSLPVAWAKEMLRHKFDYAKSYPYALDAAKDLTDYRFEQQAAIVQDYFLLKRYGLILSYKERRQTRADKNLYESVLARFLKNPAYARRGKNKENGPAGPTA